ncbi:EAL domain-containing protein [Metabacillus malikii]|uniref:Diguanylate cyclase (GGDEF)-like protein/PAS domain S-box-containing protein n=1 Tax=Metabacillus malikii TaxID=1504265 RepID=A0ABT9ZKT5_9BACI|nr:EAL domain-containing protein [Metabacillus malikii]MDQ0231830.1 diguanylate cyclase (GGDEF)-like protein/PAS domain S-box-containing protein [Metabacillus malikii]
MNDRNDINQLKEKIDNLETIINESPDIIVMKDGEGKYIFANNHALKLYKLNKDSYIGKTDEELSLVSPIFKQVYKAYMESDRQASAYGQSIKTDEVVNEQGHIYEVVKIPLFYDDGSRKALIVMSRDVTERVQSKRDLAESEERYRLILENTTDLIFVFDKNGRITFASPSVEKVIGIDKNRLLGNTRYEGMHPDDIDEGRKVLQEVFQEGKGKSTLFRFISAKKETIWVETNLEPVFIEGEVTSVVAVSRDVTEKKRLEDELKHMAFHDILTGVPNRRAFLDKLQEAITSTKNDKFALLLLDVDRFKWVNDTFGHGVGDNLLIQFVRRITKCLRKNDVIARLGGDEFVVLLPHISHENEAELIATRILDSLQNKWEINEHEFVTTSSIGISIFPDTSRDASALMKCADMTLYKAKQTGRNNFQFYQDPSSDLTDKVMVQDLEKAIINNELFLVYQPKYNLATKELNSVEALIRWQHPTRGLISPLEFIHLAEDNNLIIPITMWVLEKVCIQLKDWCVKGYKKVPISVNISAKHLEKGTLVEDVKKIINSTNTNPECLMLEITESVMISNPSLAIETIHELKELGMKIAIDDFGTGFSSLSYLLKLPVDILKLDKSFIGELSDRKNMSFVDAIVKLAHNLDLSVVAEGIETEQQHQILNQYGCDFGQGYFYSKPLISNQLVKSFLENDELMKFIK